MTNFTKSTFCVIVLMLLGAASAWAQTAPTVQWEKIYNPYPVTTFISAPTSDGGVIVATENGRIFSEINPGNVGQTIFKLNSKGDLVWRKLINDIANQDNSSLEVRELVQSTDGDFILRGLYTPTDPQLYGAFVMKIGANGELKWFRDLSSPQAQAILYGGVAATTDGGCILSSYRYNSRGGLIDNVLTRLNAQGNIITTKQLVVDGISRTPTIKVRVDGNSIFVIGSDAQILGFILKLRDDLTTEWQVTNVDTFADVITNPQGGYLAIFRYSSVTGIGTSFALIDNAGRQGRVASNSAQFVNSGSPALTRDKQGNILLSYNSSNSVLPIGSKFFSIVQLDLSNPQFITGREIVSSTKLPQSFNIGPDGSYFLSGQVKLGDQYFVGFVSKLSVTTGHVTTLALSTPNYDCNTGQLTLNTTGGNGSTIEFRIAGLRDWASSNSFSVPIYQRNGTTFTLEARQNGQMVSLAFTTACGTTTTPPSTTTTTPPVNPPGNSFAVSVAAYDCNTGLLSAVVNNPNGPVEYRIIGLRDWSGSNNFSVPSYQRNGTSFKVEARTSLGAYTSTDFTTACGTTPTTPPVTPPVTPPTGTALRFEIPAFYCETGLLRLITSGGDGTQIEYRAPGLRDWANTTDLTVPTYQRTGTTFTLYARQSGREITTQYTTSCPVTARVAGAETGAGWRVSVLGNPVEDQLQLRLSGLAGQTLGLSLIDATGRVLTQRSVSVQSEGQTETLSVRGPAGVYLVRAQSGGQQQTLKLLKK